MKYLLLALALGLSSPALAQYPCGTNGTYPCGATPITATASGTTGAVAATLAAAAGKFTYVCGFHVNTSGATAGTSVTVAVSGLLGGTINFAHSLGAVGTAQNPLNVNFSTCVQSSAVNTAIVVTQPGAGAGATNAITTAWGYQM
jgi:hypothetical protein